MSKKLLVCALLLPLLVTSFIVKASAEAPDLTPNQRYEIELEHWSERLGECESQNRPGAINPKDSDGLPKFGYHQYMPSTFIHFAKKYNIYPDITVDTAFVYMLDKQKTTKLTKEVMRQNPKEFSHWGRTCRNFAGNPPLITDYEKTSQ